MDSVAPTLVRLFDESVPPDLQRGIVRLLDEDYLQAASIGRDLFPPAVAYYHIPHHRRALVERDIVNLANRYDGVRAWFEPTNRPTHYFAVIEAGLLRFTVSRTRTPNIMVRPALFRSTDAKKYQYQAVLPADEFRRPEEHGPYQCAVLVHGPAPRQVNRIGFISVNFPDPDCSYWVEKINLLDRHAALIQPVATDSVVISEAPVSLKSTRQNQSSSG